MNNRNYSIDILKFICACLIVFLHTKFKWNDAIMPLTRCAVPCFLIISGYLLYTEFGIGQKRLRRNIKNIFHILAWATLLFLIIKEAITISHGEFFIPSLKQWLCFLVFNENPFGMHLWYLGAYLYVLLIMTFVDKYKLWKPMLIATPFLILGDLLLGKYSLLLLNCEFYFVLVRNFFFVGIPYFMIGTWIKKHRMKLLSVNKCIYLGGVITFSITSIIEKEILLFLDKNPVREHYFSTTFLAIFLFLFVLSFKKVSPTKISRIGATDSLYIYIFHPLFIMTIPYMIKNFLYVQYCYQVTAPFVVLLLTIIFTVFLRKLRLIK